MLQWTWIWRYLFEIVTSFSLDTGSAVGLLGHIVVLFFSFLRNLHTVLHSGCTNLHSHQQYTGFPFFHICETYFLFFFFIIVILTDVRWYVTFDFDLYFSDEMATHSSVLAWRIPGTEESGGLPSMGSHRVRHDWSNLAAAADDDWYWVPFHVLVVDHLSSLEKCRSSFSNWIFFSIELNEFFI